VSGAISGAAFTGLAGGNPLDGLWKGAVSGLAGGLVGGAIGGGIGAFAGGATSGWVGASLNGADPKDIFKSALFGGLTSFGSYQLQQAVSYGMYRRAGGEWNYKQFYKISVASQRSFAWGVETAGWITNDDVKNIVYGDGSSVKVPPRPGNEVASFHSHPNEPGTIQWQSPTDLMIAKQNNDINYVIGWNEMYKNNPMTHPYYRSLHIAYGDAYIPTLLTTYINNLNQYPFYWYYFGY
jgi:hypothetical protein